MQELGGVFLFAVAFGLLIAVLVNAGFLLWAAGMVGIEERSFGKAIGVTILGGMASGVASFLLAGVPIVNFVVGFLVYALVAMPIFATSYGKALGASVVAWVLSLVVVGGGFLLLALATGISLTGLW